LGNNKTKIGHIPRMESVVLGSSLVLGRSKEMSEARNSTDTEEKSASPWTESLALNKSISNDDYLDFEKGTSEVTAGWIALLFIMSILIAVFTILGLHFQGYLPNCVYKPCPGYRS